MSGEFYNGLMIVKIIQSEMHDCHTKLIIFSQILTAHERIQKQEQVNNGFLLKGYHVVEEVTLNSVKLDGAHLS